MIDLGQFSIAEVVLLAAIVERPGYSDLRHLAEAVPPRSRAAWSRALLRLLELRLIRRHPTVPNAFLPTFEATRFVNGLLLHEWRAA